MKQTWEVFLESPVDKSFRCKLAADSLDIDVTKKSQHHLKVEVDFPEQWDIGVIYGASGSGKTTLAKAIFGPDIFASPLKDDSPILNQLPEELTQDECTKLLNGIGLNSVPCWIRPVYTLSNGQRARAEAVLLMCLAPSQSEKSGGEKITCIDEWTSVVDRTVAKAMSQCLQKFARKQKKRIILLSCHYDIIEWVKPDWLIDCNKQEFVLPKSKDFFFTEREKINFTVREVGRDSWRYFSKYHYLSDKLPGGDVTMYGLFIGEDQIGFKCFANYTPHVNKKEKKIYHANRLVIHPDYSGLGLGLPFSEITNDLFLIKKNRQVRIMAKFSALPMYKILSKSTKWRYLKTMRKMDKMVTGKISERRGTFREYGATSYCFEYIG